MLFKVTNVDGDVELVNTSNIVSVFPETDDDNKKTGKTVIITDQARMKSIGPITESCNKVILVRETVDDIYDRALKSEQLSMMDYGYEPDQL